MLVETGTGMSTDADDEAIGRLLDSHPPRQVDAGAGVLSYREAGQGPVLLLLHGIGSASASWLHQLDALSARYRVIAWDAPGYGSSTPLTPSAPTAADYAHALASLADTLALPPFVLLGHSLGALVAGAFAASRDTAAVERLRGLVLASPAGGHAALASELRQARLEQRIGQMDTLGPAGLARERAAHLLSPTASPAAVALVRWNMARLHPTGYAQAARMLADGNLTADVARLRMPVTVFCGSADNITPPDSCRKIADACPGAGWQLFPGLGHALYIEAPDTVNAAIQAFIGGLQ